MSRLSQKSRNRGVFEISFPLRHWTPRCEPAREGIRSTAPQHDVRFHVAKIRRRPHCPGACCDAAMIGAKAPRTGVLLSPPGSGPAEPWLPLPPDLKLRLSTIPPDHLHPTSNWRVLRRAAPRSLQVAAPGREDYRYPEDFRYFVQFDGHASYAYRPIGRADRDVNARSFDPELCIR